MLFAALSLTLRPYFRFLFTALEQFKKVPDPMWKDVRWRLSQKMTPMEMAQALQGDSPPLLGVRIVLASILSFNHFELVQHAIAERSLARVNVNAILVGLLLPVSRSLG